MRTAIQELTLSSALSDPLIRTLMTADKVDPVKLEAMLRRIAKELKARPKDLERGPLRMDDAMVAAHTLRCC